MTTVCKKLGVLLLLIPACQLAPDSQGVEQCAGNHPADSLAVWLQAAGSLVNTPGVTGITAHPSTDCIAIGVTDSSYIGAVETHLQELGIPRDAAVIAPDEE
jgi:hypothetical protein